MDMKKGQVAIEYLMIVGFVLVVLIPGLVVYYNYTSSSQDKITTSKADKIAQQVVDAVDSVYYYGEGSQNTMTIDLPENVEYVDFDGKEITIGIALENGDITEIVRASDVPMEGTIYNTPGKKDIIIKAFADKVVVNSIEKKMGLMVKSLDNINTNGLKGSVDAITAWPADLTGKIYGRWVVSPTPTYTKGSESFDEAMQIGLQFDRTSGLVLNKYDYITLVYDRGQRQNVYLPPLSLSSGKESLTLYVGSDGSTYYKYEDITPEDGVDNKELIGEAQARLPDSKIPLTIEGMPSPPGDDCDGLFVSNEANMLGADIYYFLVEGEGTLRELARMFGAGGAYDRVYDERLTSCTALRFLIMYTAGAGPTITEGDYVELVELSWDGSNFHCGPSHKVYLPADLQSHEVDCSGKKCVTLYIARDGSTYYNAELTNPAQSRP